MSDSLAETAAIVVNQLSHRYATRLALADLCLEIAQREVFAVLGPNGSGKTTLFRILSTLTAPQEGTVSIFGNDLVRCTRAVRSEIGVVFQAASLDKKLTVQENIRHQAALYGLSGERVRLREAELLEQLGLADRRQERTETLSGGLRRRVELAKGMIHQPRLLLMDEPSTGLDPGTRIDFWQYLDHLRAEFGVTIVLTTHLLDEADRADRIAILNQGRLVALDQPDVLRASVGGDSITITTPNPQDLAQSIHQQFDVKTQVMGDQVRVEHDVGHRFVGALMESFADNIQAITLGKPSLEDVFINKTGHRFWSSPVGTVGNE